MSFENPVSGSEPVTIEIPFAFEAEIRQHKRRKTVRRFYKSKTFVEVQRIPAAETAYTVELRPDHSVDILLHQGRLMWPLRYAAPLRDPVSDDTFQMLQDGKLDLFSDGKLATAGLLDDDDSWKEIVQHGENDALSRINRNIARCFLLGKELFAEGGVPIYVTRNRELAPTIRVASTGASRSGEPSVDGLAIQPGGFHSRSLQDSLARGLFRVPSVSDKTRSPNEGYPRIIAHRTDSVDAIDLRVDGTFRMFWQALNQKPIKKGDETLKWSHSRFEESISGTLPDLTARRCEALHDILANFRFSKRTGDILQDVLATAARAGRTITPLEYRRREDEYIGEFADAPAAGIDSRM